jgi:hypothetical protein
MSSRKIESADRKLQFRSRASNGTSERVAKPDKHILVTSAASQFEEPICIDRKIRSDPINQDRVTDCWSAC